MVNAPVWRASTHLYDDVAALDAGDKTNEDGRFFYGRRGAPTQWSLAEALTELEPGAHGTMLYPSGVAAITGALLSALQPGDVLLMSDNAYDPSRSFAQGFLKRWGVETRFFDPLIGAGISDLFCERTRAILLESPGSLTFEVSDIPAICAAAKAHKGQREIVTLLDFSWDGHGAPKMLEYNADTPTSLIEASVAQWYWLQEVVMPKQPRADQFNSLHEKLIERWKEIVAELPSKTVHFACVAESEEDVSNLDYLRDVAMQGGVDAKFIDVEQIVQEATFHPEGIRDDLVKQAFRELGLDPSKGLFEIATSDANPFKGDHLIVGGKK